MEPGNKEGRDELLVRKLLAGAIDRRAAVILRDPYTLRKIFGGKKL
jgi:hypothetical protein